MKRRVFIGSSRERLDKAAEIRTSLASVPDLECVFWTSIFDPTNFVLESLEGELAKLSGAILIATPDDVGEIRNKLVITPRENVMLEFGLMSARLGRRNVVICQYGEAELPSDLKGLNLIKMDSPTAGEDETAHKALIDWAGELLGTVEGVPRTVIMHGYSGSWHFELALDQWRHIDLKFPDSVEVNGDLALLIPMQGTTMGHGQMQASLTFHLPARGEPRGLYAGQFQVAHVIADAQCCRDGSVHFTSRIACSQILVHKGDPWPELAALDEPPEPWQFNWSLQPLPDSSRTLTGSFYSKTGGTVGRVISAVKL